MNALSRESLVGHWVHAHEEDDERGQVFRPADRELPPSRGRAALELRPDGELVETQPGPTDVPAEGSGTWSVDGGILVLSRAGERERRLRVVDVQPDRLILRPV